MLSNPKVNAETRIIPLLLIRLGQTTFMGRGMLRRFLLYLLDLMSVGYVRVDYRGIPYLFHMDNNTERKAIFGRYDIKEFDFLSTHMSDPNSVFIDIGANSGFYTNFILSKSGKGSTVVAIEPNDKMINRIKYNASLLSNEHTDGKQLIVEQKAISDSAGFAFLNLEWGLGAAKLQANQTSHTVRVETIPLYDLIKKVGISKIDALKIDVEGYEDRALVPFINSTSETLWPSSIVIEYTWRERWGTDIIKLLESKGYKIVGNTVGNLLLQK